MSKKQAGFAHIGILLIVLILAAVGAAGWYVWHKNHKTNQTSTTNAQADCPNNVQPCNDTNSIYLPKNFPLIKEWGVKITFPDQAKAQYVVTNAKDPSTHTVVSTMAVWVKGQDGNPCQTLGVYLLRTPNKSDKGTLLARVDGKNYYIQGDQAGCQEFPLRDKIAEELKTAKIESLRSRSMSTPDGKITFLLPKGWSGNSERDNCIAKAVGECQSNTTFTDINIKSTYAYEFKSNLGARDWYKKSFGDCNSPRDFSKNDRTAVSCSGLYGMTYTVSNGSYVVYFRGGDSLQDDKTSGFYSLVNNLIFE